MRAISIVAAFASRSGIDDALAPMLGGA
jgi:hypothetical protein